jgi:hypothetical protein
LPPLEIGDFILLISDLDLSLLRLDPAKEETVLFLSLGDGKVSLREGTILWVFVLSSFDETPEF